jgi:Co/Zn/Cd efflux system component
MNSNCCEQDCRIPDVDGRYRRILWAALGLNIAMFVVEISASFVADSVSLRADALDFLGDAANYAIALAVIGFVLRWRAGAALIKGAVMGLFGVWVAASTIYNAIVATLPKAELMGAIGLLALAINLFVAALLYRYRRGDSQAMSVWVCTRNDCIVNIGVILAGAGVWASGTPWPDIAVAAIVAYLGLSSALRVTRRAIGEIRGVHALHGVPAE